MAKPTAISTNYIDSSYDTNTHLWDGTAAAESVKATKGALTGAFLYNGGATQLYVQFFDDSDAPAADEIPKISLPLPASAGIVIDGRALFANGQKYMENGIGVGISTTVEKYAAHGTPSDVEGTLFYL